MPSSSEPFLNLCRCGGRGRSPWHRTSGPDRGPMCGTRGSGGAVFAAKAQANARAGSATYHRVVAAHKQPLGGGSKRPISQKGSCRTRRATAHPWAECTSPNTRRVQQAAVAKTRRASLPHQTCRLLRHEHSSQPIPK